MESVISQMTDAFKTTGLADAQQLAAQWSISLYDGDRVQVVIHSNDLNAPNLIAGVPGVFVETTYENLTQALVPLSVLEQIAAMPEVSFIRQPYSPILDTVDGEGVPATNASALHAAGIKGQGVKVAILDVGFQGYQSLLGGDLPATVVTKSFRANGDITGGGEVHGTACAEIVHEMAPAASLYLVNFGTDVEWFNAIDWIMAQGVKIMSVSIGWNPDPHDGTGPFDVKVDEVRNAGILWVNAAGNEAQAHYEATFIDADGDTAHEFVPGDEVLFFQVSAGVGICVRLMWDDWPASNQDYDLYLFDSQLKVIAKSEGTQDGTQPPIEFICGTPTSTTNFGIAIYKYQATRNVKLEVFTSGVKNMEYITPGGSVTTPATAYGALAVGAVDYHKYSPSSFQIEPFSSQGPTNDGRTKPELAAPDGVSGASYGPNGFYGTSAACPHVAGGAALVLSTNPSLTPDQLKNELMTKHAVDVGSPGVDNISGAGLLKLSQPPVPDIVSYSLNKTTAVIGEPFQVTVQGKNIGSSTANFGGITVKVRQAYANGVEVTESHLADGASAQKSVWWKGETLGTGHTAQYLHVEPTWENWNAGNAKTVVVTITPKKPGTYDIYTKMYLASGSPPHPRDPSGSTPDTDHQGEGTYEVGTVTVGGPDIDVTPNPKPFDYGDVKVGEFKDQSFNVKNVGTATLSVSSTTLVGSHSSEFEIISGGGSFNLEPGQTRDVGVRFKPQSAGTKNAILRFASNDPDENPFDVSLTGTGVGVPDIDVMPPSFDYGNVNVGASKDNTFVVKNVGGGPLSVSSTTLEGSNPSEFHIIDGGAPFDLKSGEIRNVVVRFQPQSAGTKKATLRFANNDPDENPKDVPLEGMGVVGTDIDVTPVSFDYGNVNVGASKDNTFVVKNVGTALLSVSSTTLEGSNKDDFKILSLLPPGSFSLAPGATQNVVVQFMPQTPGVKSAILRFASDDPDETQKDVPLTGVGVQSGASTKTLSISGVIRDENGQPVGSGFTVVITNLNKPQFTKTTTTNPDGSYSEGFFDLENPVAEEGDMIEIVVSQGTVVCRNKAPYLGGTSITIDCQISLTLHFTMTIRPGVNMIGRPLDPGQSWTLKELLDLVGADFMFYYDGSDFQFLDKSKPDVSGEGGVAYVVVRNNSEPLEVTFEGVAWENTSRPQMSVSSTGLEIQSTKTLSISGVVRDENDQPVGAGLIVVITNLNKPQFTKTTATNPDGSYSEGFFDLSNPVATDGDVIEVVVKSADGATTLGRAEKTYRDTDGNAITIDVSFPKTKFFEMTINPGINMISRPLDPEAPWTLNNLLVELESGFLFYYDYEVGDFIFLDTNPFQPIVPGEGGQGYVVVRDDTLPPVVKTFEGAAWENTGVPAAPAIRPSALARAQTNVFAVVGQLQAPLKGLLDGVSLRLRNRRTQRTISANLLKNGHYDFVIFEPFRPDAIAAGDSLEITIEDSRGRYQREMVVIDIGIADVQSHRVTVVPIELTQVPQETKVFPNYPNPFNPETWIPFQLAHDSEVTIKIHDVSGNLVRSLELGRIPVGQYIDQQKAAYWDGKNQMGERVASGVYFYTFKAGNFVATKKLVILK